MESLYPIFGPFLLWANGWMHQDDTWHGGRPQPRRLCVRWGPSPLPKKGAELPPQFSAHFYCGQTAGCMPFGMEVGLNSGDFVLHEDTPPPQKGAEPASPILGPFLLWRNGWMHQNATWYGGRPQPRGLLFDGDQAPPPKKRGQSPKFSAHFYCRQTAG